MTRTQTVRVPVEDLRDALIKTRQSGHAPYYIEIPLDEDPVVADVVPEVRGKYPGITRICIKDLFETTREAHWTPNTPLPNMAQVVWVLECLAAAPDAAADPDLDSSPDLDDIDPDGLTIEDGLCVETDIDATYDEMCDREWERWRPQLRDEWRYRVDGDRVEIDLEYVDTEEVAERE